jgi:hypothetical protein
VVDGLSPHGSGNNQKLCGKAQPSAPFTQ